jgi:DNA topoisomerase-2
MVGRKDGSLKISKFYSEEYMQAALYVSYRSIANYIDGLKPSGRKVVHTIDENNITKKIKVSQLISKVAEQDLYLHGEQSLSGVVTGLARDYVGGNNINILTPDGNFGSRFVPEPSASRYIYTYKSDSFNELFNADDRDVLEEQWFEGERIEYKYYVPILPLILINGSEGIGNGFAQKILPRNIEDVKQEIANKLKSTKYTIKPLIPYFKGFNGLVEQNGESNRWIVSGSFTRVNTSTIHITEVPIGYDLKSYLQVLDDLVEKKVIKDYDDNSNDDNFDFLIRATRDFVAQSDDEIFDKLRLKKTYSENYTCTDEKNKIIEFNDDAEIITEFIRVRLKYYTKRKNRIIEKLKQQIVVNENKVRFITAVIDDSSVVSGKTKKQLEAWLKKEEFDMVDESYNYLINMPIYSLTTDRVKDLNKQLVSLQKELDSTSKKTNKKMWLEDLENTSHIA